MVSRETMLGWLTEFETTFSSRKWKAIAERLCMLGPCDLDPDRYAFSQTEWDELITNSLRKLDRKGFRQVINHYKADIHKHETIPSDEWGVVPGTICTEKGYAETVLNFLLSI